MRIVPIGMYRLYQLPGVWAKQKPAAAIEHGFECALDGIWVYGVARDPAGGMGGAEEAVGETHAFETYALRRSSFQSA